MHRMSFQPFIVSQFTLLLHRGTGLWTPAFHDGIFEIRFSWTYLRIPVLNGKYRIFHMLDFTKNLKEFEESIKFLVWNPKLCKNRKGAKTWISRDTFIEEKQIAGVNGLAKDIKSKMGRGRWDSPILQMTLTMQELENSKSKLSRETWEPWKIFFVYAKIESASDLTCKMKVSHTW